MNNINLSRLQKLWNHATKNANPNEASVAALKFTKMISSSGLKVHLYAGQSPATEKQIKAAIDKAYIQGQMEAKETYQRILERQKNEFYNEGYRDGRSNSYTQDDLNREYNKGFEAGKRDQAIQKAPSQAIKQEEKSTNRVFVNSSTSSTHPLITFQNGSGTISINKGL